MWEMLRRSESELLAANNNPKRKHRPAFWRHGHLRLTFRTELITLTAYHTVAWYRALLQP
ncbi:hypothetical protein Gotur_016238 [Gossypium turneri]